MLCFALVSYSVYQNGMLDLKVIPFSHSADDASETTADSGTVKFLADVSSIHTSNTLLNVSADRMS